MKGWCLAVAFLGGCQASIIEADTLILNGTVFSGDATPGVSQSIAIKDDRIIHVGAPDQVVASTQIDARGLYVMPGFIDPHTHSFADLMSDDAKRRRNDNYLFQGVTTVINGNDGFGEPDIGFQLETLGDIGTNTALFIGHGALRQSVMGGADRAPTAAELIVMKSRVAADMDAGALGLSTGLFYAPGSFADTVEIIELTTVAARYGGIYDSHIRDESNYSIGLLAAVDEVLTIAEQAGIPANIAHVKALGTDVWGLSDEIVRKVEAARAQGLPITADQYPWRASGTRISNALLPRWVKAGTANEYQDRLEDVSLLDEIRGETAENLRRRGGADSILITAPLSARGSTDWAGKTLGDLAEENETDPVEMALTIARQGDARIASFNMNVDDMQRFMSQAWVMTSSDGSTGHPRKYASYPKKFRDYVVEQRWISVADFVHRSTGLVADTFGICERGYLRSGYFADIAIIDPDAFAPKADFQNPERLSEGVTYLFVNGEAVIDGGVATNALPGRGLKRCRATED